MVTYRRVESSRLYVPPEYIADPAGALFGLFVDKPTGEETTLAAAWDTAVLVAWSSHVVWDDLFPNLPQRLSGLQTGRRRLAFFNESGNLFAYLTAEVGGALGSLHNLPLTPTFNLQLAAGTRLEAEPTTDRPRLTPDSTPLRVRFRSDINNTTYRFDIDGPIALIDQGTTRGCLEFRSIPSEEDLNALGVRIEYVRSLAPTPVGGGTPVARMVSARFPIFHSPNLGIPFQVSADLADPFEMERSFWSMPPGHEVGSHFETVLGHPVKLRALEDSRLVFDRSVREISDQSQPNITRTYLTPSGAFELVVDESEGSGWPERHALVLGTSTSEYVTFRPRRKGTPGDRILFHAHRPATDRASLPNAAPAAPGTLAAGAERILTDVATTSWLSFAPGTATLANEGPALVGQPAELEFFTDSPSTGPVGAPRTMDFDPRPRLDAAQRPMPAAPFLGVRSLPQEMDEVQRMESALVAQARKEQTLSLDNGAARVAGRTAEKRATPHGFPVTLEGDRWQELLLGKTPETLPNFALMGMDEPATRALSGNRTFLVATRFGEGLAQLADRLEIAGWSFASDIDSDGIQGPNPGDPSPHVLHPTFLFKYHDLSVFDLLGLDPKTGQIRSGHKDQDNWTEAEAFNYDWRAVREQLRLYLSQTFQRHQELGNQSPYGPFLERLRNPAWNGLLLLNTAVVPKGLPLQVQGLLAGINLQYFRGHHVGLDLNQLGQQGFDIERSSFFGVVDYPQPQIENPEPLDPERRGNKSLDNGWPSIKNVPGEGRIANFQVEYLRIQFESSEVRRFDCRVKLWLEKLFRETLPKPDPSNPPPKPILTFDGQYERRRDDAGQVIETYTFAHERDYTFTIDSLMLDTLTIRRLQMTTVEADDQRVLSRFSFWGDLSFQPIGDFDLFGIDKIDFGDLGIDLDFDLVANIKKFLPRLGSLRFDLLPEGRRGNSFFASLPFRLKFFQFGDGLSLDKLGYFKFDNPDFGTDLFDFALGFDIDLGSLGSLAKKLEGLRLETLFGWLPKRSGGRNFAIGFKLQGTGGGSLDLGIEGVMKLVIEKLKVEDFEHGGKKHFAIQAVNTRLEVLGKRFPADSKLKLFLFVDPGRLVNGTVSDMAWLATLNDSSAGDGFRLPLLALGQRVNAYPQGGTPSTRDVTTHIKKLGELNEAEELVSITSGNDLKYAPEREWTVALQAVLWELADLDLVFLDPDLYGIRLRVPGNGAQPQLFAIDILYRKISDDLGVYSIELAVPDAWRQMEFGALSLTLPIIGLDLYTNGDFQIDVGFPWNMDFSRSCQVQVLPFLGSGGFYYAQLSSASSNLVPIPRDEDFIYDPVVQLGFGARLGIGKEFRKGILRAGLTVSVFGILEGAWGRLRELSDNPSSSLRPPNNYLVVAGTVGILGEVFGHVDFGIVKAGVSIRIWVAWGWVLETYQPLLLSVEAGVSVRVKVVIGRIKIFGKTIKITISFSFSTRLRFEWTLGKGNVDEWNRLFRSSANLLTSGLQPPLQPDLGRVRCLDWIDAPTVFGTIQKIRLRFAPDVTLVNGKPHTVALLTIEPEALKYLGRALVLWAGERWAVDAPTPVDAAGKSTFQGNPADRMFSIHDLRHLEACLACPRSLARGDSAPLGEASFQPLDATALGKLFLPNLLFQVTESEEVLGSEEGPQLAVFPFFSRLDLRYELDGHEVDTVQLWDVRATPSYLDDLDRKFDRLRILLGERRRANSLAAVVEDTVPVADFLLEDYCHLVLRQTVDALEGLLAAKNDGDPTKVGTALPLATLLDELDQGGGDVSWKQIGEAVSRFYLHGLRIPKLDASGDGALFQVAALEQRIPQGSGMGFRVSVSENTAQGAQWLEVLPNPSAPDVGETVVLSELQQFPASVPAHLESFEARSPIRLRHRRYPLQSRSVWSVGSTHRTLWPLPAALRDRLHAGDFALQAFETTAGALGAEPNAQALDTSWATRLTLRLQRLKEKPLEGTLSEQESQRPVYRLLPLGEMERSRLDRLVDAAPWLATTTPRIVLRSAPGATSDSLSDPGAAVVLWRTDLSTEPKPTGPSLAAASKPALLVRASLGDVHPFLTLLRRASLVRSNGYFLSYRGSDGSDLPDQIFDEKGNGELPLLLLHAPTGSGDPVSTFADTAVLAGGVGGGSTDDRKVVYVRAAQSSDDVDHDLPFAPGTVGFRAYRKHPDHLGGSTTEAERSVAEQYHLLDYEIFAPDGTALTSPDAILPVAPREIGQNQPGEEPRPRPPGLAADDWSYEHILPAHKLLAGADASPYAAVGQDLRVDLRFRDPYGNRLPGSPAGSLKLPVRYIDRLLSPTDWPSMVSTWDVSAQHPRRIMVQLRFDPRGFYADRSSPNPAEWAWLDPTTPDEKGRAAAERIQDVLTFYNTVRHQLQDLRTELHLSASFHTGNDLVLDARDRDALVQLVDEIQAFLQGLPGTGQALPTDQTIEPPGRRFLKTMPISPTKANFDELRVTFELRRPKDLVDPQVRTEVPESVRVKAPIEAAVALPASASSESSAALRAFAERFEGAFTTLALAVGTGTAGGRALWAVRRSLVTLELIGKEAAFFALPPLSNQLVSGEVKVPDYKAVGLPGGKIRLADVDLDLRLREFFSDVERFLQPDLVDRLLQVVDVPPEVDRVIRAKNQAASLTSPKLQPVLQDTPPKGGTKRAIDLLQERMRNDLREGYDVDTLVIVPVRIANVGTTTGRAPVAYGRLIDPLATQNLGDAAQDATPLSELRRFSLANLPLSTDAKGRTHLVFALDSKRETRQAEEPLRGVKYRLTHIERGIDTATEDRDTAWLQLVRAERFEHALANDVDVPVPLRQFPEPPTLENHDGYGDRLLAANFAEQVDEARHWSYELAMNNLFVDQDSIYLEVLYNSRFETTPGGTLRLANTAEAPRGDLAALASYQHHRTGLWSTFEGLLADTADPQADTADPQADTAGLKKVKAHAKIFAQLVDGVVASLAPLVRKKGDLEPQREVYKIDDDLLQKDISNGRRRLEIERLLDAFQGSYRVLPRKPDGEPYRVRKENGTPGVDHRVVSYQPEGVQDRFRPLVTLSQLDVLQAESAWGGFSIRRNEEFGQRPANPLFVYETPAVRFGESFTPHLDRFEPLVFDGKSAPLAEQIEKILLAIVHEVLPDRGEPSPNHMLRLDMRWSYESGRLGEALGRERLTVRPPHPIALLPAVGLGSRDDVKTLATTTANRLDAWRTRNRTVKEGHLVADIRVYGRIVEKPVLRLRRVAIPTTRIT